MHTLAYSNLHKYCTPEDPDTLLSLEMSSLQSSHSEQSQHKIFSQISHILMVSLLGTKPDAFTTSNCATAPLMPYVGWDFNPKAKPWRNFPNPYSLLSPPSARSLVPRKTSGSPDLPPAMGTNKYAFAVSHGVVDGSTSTSNTMLINSVPLPLSGKSISVNAPISWSFLQASKQTAYTQHSNASVETKLEAPLRWLMSVLSMASFRNVSSLFLAFLRKVSCDKFPLNKICTAPRLNVSQNSFRKIKADDNITLPYIKTFLSNTSSN
nr:hypothetical protein Iba_chr09aCG17450 [Ipomoea batatas]